MRGLHAIDADGHVSEDRVDWVERLPQEFRDRAPRIVPDENGRRTVLFDGYRYPNSSYEGKGRGAAMRLEGALKANPDDCLDAAPVRRLNDSGFVAALYR